MKSLIILMLLLVSALSKAQTWEEFSKQKETQKKYLLQQLAGLKFYVNLLKEGYSTVNKGLKTITWITEGELDLHTTFFESLKAVNPVVAKNKKVADILALQISISKHFKLGSKTHISRTETQYFESVRSNVLEECLNEIDELLLVVSANKLEMKDDERMKRIDKLYASMKYKYQFTQSFVSQTNLLNLQRLREERNTGASQKTYEPKN